MSILTRITAYVSRVAPPIRPVSSHAGSPAGGARRKAPAFFRPHWLDRRVLDVHIHAHGRTNDPIWILVNRATRPSFHLPLVDALAHHGVPVSEFRRWSASARSRTATAALRHLAKQPADPPPWLILHIISHMVRSPAEALGAFKLVMRRLSTFPPHLAPWLLVITAHALARTDALAALPRLISAFLNLSSPPNALQFNHLLQAVSRFPASPGAARATVSVLDAMHERELPLHRSTYRILLANRFVTHELAVVLQRRMVEQGVVPDSVQLHGFLKVFARHGAIHDASRYLDAVHEFHREQRPKRDSESASRGRRKQESKTIDPRAHATYLSAHKSRFSSKSAFDYLAKLARLETSADLPPSPTAAIRKAKSRQRSRLPAKGSLRHAQPTKESLATHNFTTLLAAVGRDRRAPVKALLRVFDAIPRPTVTSYTALVRGLLLKCEFAAAADAWDKLAGLRRRLDARALAVGAQALTRAGRPDRAFETLVRRARYIRPQIKGRSRARAAGESAPALDVAAVNAFMTSLLRIGRPDVVLRIWDDMELVFRVRPDVASLDLMLRAAREMGRLSTESVRGTLAQLGASLPFFRHAPEPDAALEPHSRMGAMRGLRGMLAVGAVPAVDGAWGGVPAWKRARRVFRQVLLGNFPELAGVQPPVAAYRESGDDLANRPLADLAHQLFNTDAHSRDAEDGTLVESWVTSPAAPPDAVRELARQGLHPPGAFAQLIPSDANFCAYMLLLCAAPASRANEVPLVLAWMRALDVQPSRKTLALAAVYWAEVSMRAPWVEREGGGVEGARSGGGRYARLIRWMREWVGEERMPGDQDVYKWMKRVQMYREGKGKV